MMPSAAMALSVLTVFLPWLSPVAGKGNSVAVASTRFQIRTPATLSKEGGYAHTVSRVGSYPRKGTIREKLYFLSRSLCHISNINQITVYDPASGRNAPISGGIFLVRPQNSNCGIATAARNAQMAGARGLVVIENQSAETEGTMWSMSSNGDDRDVSIPVIGIHEEDGQEILNMLNRVGEEKDHEEIRKLLKQRENVLAEISFDVPDPESNILLDVLLDPSERSTGFLLTSVHLRELMDVFDDLVITTRHFMYDGAEFGCTKTPRNDECTTQCTNNGRYCAVVPYDAAGQGVHGADVVAEILRRDCIQNNYDAVSKTWITYVEAFHRTCISETRNFQDFSSPSCIDKALKHANVDKKVVDTCMSSSGSISSNQANTILENELGSMRPSASMVGQISLNNRYVTSRIHSFDSLFDAICAAYATGYEHPVCLKCTDFDSKLFGSRYDCVMGSMIPKPQKRFAGFVAFCLVIGLITLQFVYTRWKIQKIVTQELKRYNLIPSFDEENRFHDNSIELVESTRNDSGEIFESPTPSLTYRGPRN